MKQNQTQARPMAAFLCALSAILLLGSLVVGLLACGGSSNNAGGQGTSDDGKLNIVATIFPEYDWVREILGEEAENVNLSLLLSNGVDIHSFQPSAADILTIATSDVFIYVGGESDAWVADALKGNENPDRKVINLLDVLGDAAKEEELVEGMQHDHEHEEAHDHEAEEAEHEEVHDHEAEEAEHEAAHDHGSEEANHDHEDGEAEYDEHVWLSLRNVQIFVREIANVLKEADPENAEAYEANAKAYLEKLQNLDAQYEQAVKEGTKHTLLFGDRFPFRYLVDDYGIQYYAAFAGCSAETEASFQTIVFLAGKLDELGLSHVLTIEGSDESLARTIIASTKEGNQTILKLDSMQATTAKDIAAGVTYLTIMEKNLEVLKEALKN